MMPSPKRKILMNNNPKAVPLYCSFCFKSQYEVRKMIVGPEHSGVICCICDECINLCLDIIDDDMSKRLDEEYGKVWVRTHV